MPMVQAEAADRRKTASRRLRQISFLIHAAIEMLALSDPISYVLLMAKKKASKQVAIIEEIDQGIHVVRGQRVFMDANLAVLYGSPLGNWEQVSRNKDRFPDDF